MSHDKNFKSSQYEALVAQTTSNDPPSIAANSSIGSAPNANHTVSDSRQYPLRRINSGRLSEVAIVTTDVDKSPILSNGTVEVTNKTAIDITRLSKNSNNIEIKDTFVGASGNGKIIIDNQI